MTFRTTVTALYLSRSTKPAHTLFITKLEVLTMNEKVIALLKEQPWYLATYAAPNAVPVAFKDVTEDGKLIVW